MLVLLAVLVTCHRGPLAQLDLREERAALLATDSAFAVSAARELLPAFRDMLDDDVIFLDPGERVLFGKTATLAMLASDGMSAAATQDWRAVLSADALSEGKAVKASADGADVLIYKDGDEVSAISDTCSHRGCSLADGDVSNGVVECPCHGSTFRLADGGIVRGPATAPQPAYDARVVDGRVEVKVRDPSS